MLLSTPEVRRGEPRTPVAKNVSRIAASAPCSSSMLAAGAAERRRWQTGTD